MTTSVTITRMRTITVTKESSMAPSTSLSSAMAEATPDTGANPVSSGLPVTGPRYHQTTSSMTSKMDSTYGNTHTSTRNDAPPVKPTHGVVQAASPSHGISGPAVKMGSPAVDTVSGDSSSRQTLGIEPPTSDMVVPGYPAINRTDIVPTHYPHVSQAVRHSTALSVAFAVMIAALAFW